MKKINKKAFTLVELLAVIIVLIIIILIAYNIIKRNVDESLDNTIKANAGVYIKAVNGYISVEALNDDSLENIGFSLNYIKDSVKVSGTAPDAGYFTIRDSEVTESCLEYDGYSITYTNGNFSNPVKGSCEMPTTFEFAYTGDVQTFNVPYVGNYKIEAWGAKGGNNSLSTGNGAYTSGNITLNGTEVLYLYVGGKGLVTRESTAEYKAGGYNGGGDTNGQSCCGRTYGTGGGASDIRLVGGDWDDTESLVSRIMVAAGGGGGFNGNNGGNAGGLTGQNGQTSNGYGPGPGASQISGGTNTYDNNSSGSFGVGGANHGSSTGGGGGYYGGAGSGHIDAAGGGSSFISGHVGCVAIKAQSDISPRDGCTNGTTNANCSVHYSNKVFNNTVMKAGNEVMPTYDGSSTTGNKNDGHIKITYIGADESILSSYTEALYIESTGTQYIDLKYKPKTNTKVVFDLSFSGTFKPFNTYGGTPEFFGVSETDGTKAFYINFGEASNQGNVLYIWNDREYGINNAPVQSVNINDSVRTNRNLLILESGKLTYGTIEKNIIAKGSNNISSMYVFGSNSLFDANYSGAFNSYNMRLYGLSIYEGSTLVHQYKPCYKDTNIGLCDIIENKFYGNSGTGTFNKGSNV